MNRKSRVLIAGIGGASLGTELLKSLLAARRYMIYGCDISELAYGHYHGGFKETFVVDPDSYIESVLDVCRKAAIDFIIPGAEQPMILLAEAANKFTGEGIRFVGNSPELIRRFSNKALCFKTLSELGFQVPLTKKASEIDQMTFPCVVKPSTGSGGSSYVFLAADKIEAALYLEYLSKNGKTAIMQEYIPESEGEFTVGVLSLPNGQIACSIALKRSFNTKLSLLSKGKTGLISSGYSQGLIEDFPDVCSIAEKIAVAILSEGPINIQGRLKNGVLIPFEINPRFSASTYLRALAGINEVDIFLHYLSTGAFEKPGKIREGFYLRSLAEVFVSRGKLK